MKLHEKIKYLRQKHELSQPKLGEKIGIHGGHVSRLETGKYHPSVVILKKLCEVFQVSADYLLNESNDCEEVHIEDEALAERIRLLNSIDGKDKDAIIHMIDSIITKRKMVELVANELEKVS